MPCCIRHDESRTRAEGARILLCVLKISAFFARKFGLATSTGGAAGPPSLTFRYLSGFAASRILAARLRLTSMPARPGQPCKHLPRQVARTSRAKTS
jgi:hypothetical protein